VGVCGAALGPRGVPVERHRSAGRAAEAADKDTESSAILQHPRPPTHTHTAAAEHCTTGKSNAGRLLL